LHGCAARQKQVRATGSTNGRLFRARSPWREIVAPSTLPRSLGATAACRALDRTGRYLRDKPPGHNRRGSRFAAADPSGMPELNDPRSVCPLSSRRRPPSRSSFVHDCGGNGIRDRFHGDFRPRPATPDLSPTVFTSGEVVDGRRSNPDGRISGQEFPAAFRATRCNWLARVARLTRQPASNVSKKIFFGRSSPVSPYNDVASPA